MDICLFFMENDLMKIFRSLVVLGGLCALSTIALASGKPAAVLVRPGNVDFCMVIDENCDLTNMNRVNVNAPEGTPQIYVEEGTTPRP
jgi:hypothetical protein